jgi:flagella basal body P-ring formation protein FlgA
LILLWSGLVAPAWSAVWEPREVIHKYLTTNYPWAEVEVLETYGYEDLPKLPPLRVHLISGPLGRATFAFGFKSGERVVVQAQVRAMDHVVTSRRPLRPGHIIQKDDVYLALIDVRRMPREAVTSLEGAWGKTVVRAIEGNIPLGESVLGEPPIIKKGQVINLIAASPGLKIITQGEARENGRLGQQIKVTNLTSKQDVRGIPIDDRNVRVIF